ncbi:tail fiber domain-containing protein [Bdellovibrio sp. HCB2-146]|uniref:tail fiber domain-containing protein n=1 Tax=Bdellovibrio sp. HCB2-146 TaxID=3394362 RepID=UPI0039BC7B0E
MLSQLWYVFACLFAFAPTAWAAPNTLNYQGRILKANGSPLEYNNVSFVFEITSPNGNCVVYREQVDGINMQNSKGVFDVPIGTGTKLFPVDPLFTLSKAFDNGISQNCFGGTTYTPIAEDVRVLKVQFHDGTGWKVIDPPNVIRSVPFAQHAQSALTIGGMSAGDFVAKTQTPGAACSAGQVISFDGTNFVCVADQGGAGVVTSVSASAPITVSGSGNITVGINVGTAAGTVAAGNDARITGAFQSATTLGGDLSGTLPNPTVAKIQGQAVSSSAPSNGQVLKYNTGASQWQPVRFGVDDLISETGLAQFASANCASNQTLTWSSLTDIFSCTNISISESNISGSISGTKISGNISGNSAGFTGALAGDVSGIQGATSVDKIKGKTVNLTGLTDGQVLRWNNSANEWQPSADDNAGGTITALTGDVTASGSGSVAATIAANAVTSAKIADGTVVNADISATAAIVDTKLATISTAGKVANSATTGTASSVADTLVLRDPAGNFAANDVSFSSVDIRNASANKVTFNVPASFTNYALTLPTSAGTAGHVLTTNGAGVLSWTSPSAGSVTSVSATAPLSVTSATTTPQISIAAGSGDGQVLRWNTANWSSSYLNFSDLKSAAGIRQIPGTCTNAQTLVWQSASDTFACTNISLAANQVANIFAQGGNAFAADAVLGTTDNYKLSFKANNVTQMTVSDGSVALGAAAVDPNHRLTIGSDRTDVSHRGINIDFRQRSVTTGSYSNLAGVFKAQETVSPGVTNSGGLTGIWSVAFRNNLPGFDDSGTLGAMKSLYVQYGHYNSEAASTPQTTAAYGIEVSPYYRTGTISTMYDYYAHPGATGGTVTNHYGVYIAGAQKKNHFEGAVGIGTTTPQEKLHVSGDVLAQKRLAFQDNARFTVTSAQVSSLSADFSMPQYGIAAPNTGSAAELWASGNAGIRFFTNGVSTPRMNITTAGSVGIGTMSPLRPLHVAQSVAAGGNTSPLILERVNSSGTPGANELTMLQFKMPNSAGTGVVAADVGATLVDVTPSSEKGALIFRTSDDGGATIPERVRITSDGISINSNQTSSARLAVTEARTNLGSSYAMTIRGSTSSTANGTYYSIGLENNITKTVSTGVTDNGYLLGMRANTLRNYTVASDRGTLNDLTGMMVQYGHYNFDASTPTTTSAFGVRVNPYFMTGTIDSMYDFFAGDGSAGGTVNNRYGLYIAGLPKTNYLQGSLGVGTSTPTYKMHVVTTGAGAVAGFSNGTGTCTVTPNTASLSCSSDIRLKEDIDRILGLDALNKVIQLQAHTYRWKNGDGSHYIGYIAQEAEKVVPELVTTGADGYKQVSYSGFIPLLSEAIKEVNSKVELQKRTVASENADMKQEIESLRKENQDLKKTLQSFEQRLRAIEAAAQKK